MAKPKRTTLPKDFETLLEKGELEALKDVFDTCDVNARGGVFKQTALAFNACPDDLARWLVERGADISATDYYGETPLHARSRHWRGRIDILLELGADVHHPAGGRGTPLHFAADVGNISTARTLLQHGAKANAVNGDGRTPLAYALQRCSNAKIERMAPMAELLLAADNPPSEPKSLFAKLFSSPQKKPAGAASELKACVHRIGTDFEFHRGRFNPESVDAASAALEKLYALFDVPPVPRRILHDGKSPIIAKAANWQDQTAELWDLLVPSAGAADTVQGEVIRIAGRMDDELNRNGGANWDADYRKMADAFFKHIAQGMALPEASLDEARRLVSEIKCRNGDNARRLRELAINWVTLNPLPMKLAKPDYDR